MFGYHRQRAVVEAALAKAGTTRPCLTTAVPRARARALHHNDRRSRYHSSCCIPRIRPHSMLLAPRVTRHHGINKAIIGRCNCIATHAHINILLPAHRGSRTPKSNLCLMRQSQQQQSGINVTGNNNLLQSYSYRHLSSDSPKNNKPNATDKQSNVVSSTEAEESSSKPASSSVDVDIESTISSSSQIIAASSNQRKKRRRNRKSSSSQYNNHHSPLTQITGNHPKTKSFYSQSSSSTTNTKNKKLTRKQILRLTPKQRQNLHLQRIAEYKHSRGYLQTARSNVRSNISYIQTNIQQLRTTADTNLKRNVDTIQRIFKGEDVWKEKEGYDRSKDIDWDKAPEEIKANIQSNLALTQNWLHKVTEGMIPSSSAATIEGCAVVPSTSPAGSIATRIQQFHELKQNADMPMDKLWITKNVAFALMPGTLLGAYLFYTEGEMKEYYKKLEEMERDKVMGVGRKGSGGGNGNGNGGKSGGKDGGGGGMSISSAFVTEGGTAWDRLKLTVNDLVFGGAQARIDEHRQMQKKAEEEGTGGDDTLSRQTAAESSSKTHHSGNNNNESTTRTLEKNTNEDNPTIQMLLDRIQALEKQQLGTTNNRGSSDDDDLTLSEEEQHQLNYANTRAKQSPIQNRRDDHLQKTWAKQEGEKEEKAVLAVAAESETAKDNDANYSSPYTVGNAIDFATYMLEPYVESVQESAMEMVEEIKDAIISGFSEKKGESSASNEQDANIMASRAVDATKSQDSSISSSDGSTEISSSQKEDDAEESNPSAKTVVAKLIDSKSATEGTDATKSINIEKGDVAKPGRIKKWAGIVWQRVRHPFGGQGNGEDARNDTDEE